MPRDHGPEGDMSHKILVPIADGSEELEAVCIIDTLRRAGAEVTVASVGPDRQITASRGVRLVADCLLSSCGRQTWDLIVLPGGLAGAERLRDCADLVRLLKVQAGAGRPLAAICAAPAVVLAHHGILAGRRATCHPDLADRLAGNPGLPERVVTDGNIVTSQGPGTALEFALTLVELIGGQQKAVAVAQPMITAWPGPGTSGRGGPGRPDQRQGAGNHA
jgi:4-methyl-5(b-hydroxyethyl)-thiazole monophosphate biosynthesis